MSTIITKYLLIYAPPLHITAFRMLFGGILLWMLRGHTVVMRHCSVVSFWYINSLSMLLLWGKYFFRNYALSGLTATEASLLMMTTPLCVALLARSFVAEKLNTIQWLGLVIGLGGMVVSFAGTTSVPFSFSMYKGMMIVAIVCHGMRLIIKKNQAVLHYEELITSQPIQMFFGGLCAFIFCLREDNFLSSVTNWPLFCTLIMVQICVSSLLCNLIFIRMCKYYSITLLSFADCISPLCTVFYDHLFFHTTLSSAFFCSFCFLLGGLFLFYYHAAIVRTLQSTGFLRAS